MSVMQPLKLGCASFKIIARRSPMQKGLLSKRYALCRLGMQGINSVRGRRNNATSSVSAQEPFKWNLHVEVEKAIDDSQLSLPMLLYLYTPWQMAKTQMNLWKLKVFWDWSFSEAQFLKNSKQAVVILTKFIHNWRERNIRQCTTLMGYKQIMYDLFESNNLKSKDYSKNLLRFEKRHIRRAIILKIQQLPHYDHKFAFVDVVFCACRRTNDFNSISEISEMSKLIKQFVEHRKLLVPHPVVRAEFFVRFRRDYSCPASERSGQWLISTFKILKLDILNYDPELFVGSQYKNEVFNSETPLVRKQA